MKSGMGKSNEVFHIQEPEVKMYPGARNGKVELSWLCNNAKHKKKLLKLLWGVSVYFDDQTGGSGGTPLSDITSESINENGMEITYTCDKVTITPNPNLLSPTCGIVIKLMKTGYENLKLLHYAF